MSEQKLTKNQILYPRYDLLTGEILPYKNKDFYFANYYTNRQNLIKHFKTLNTEAIIKITNDIIIHRIESKGIKYSPSTVELKTLITPTVALLESLNVDYPSICNELGLINKYVYNEFLVNKKFKFIDSILVDTREQTPLTFDIKTSKVGLKFGDYAKANDYSVVIERKSISDLISTISGGFERFHKELNRAEMANSKLLVVVDVKIAKAISFNFLPHMKYSKCSPEFIFSRIRELCQSYPNVQFVFVDGRKEASNITKFALSYGSELFNYDIEYLYETGKLNAWIK